MKRTEIISFLAELMKNNTPWETSHGLLSPNKNEPTQVYNGIHFPPYSYGGTAVEVILSATHPTLGKCEEILALPYYGSDLGKVQERMGVSQRTKLFVEEVILLDPAISKLLDYISLEGVYIADNLDDISELAAIFDPVSPEMKEYLQHLSEQLKLDDIHSLNRLSSAIVGDEIEFVSEITSPEDYDYYLVCENPEIKIDEDISSL